MPLHLPAREERGRGGSGTWSEWPRGQGKWGGCFHSGLPWPGRVGVQVELLHQLHLGGVVEEGDQGLHLGGVGAEAGVVRVEDLPLLGHAGQHPGLEEGHLACRAQLRQDHLKENRHRVCHAVFIMQGSCWGPSPGGRRRDTPALGSSGPGEQRRPVAGTGQLPVRHWFPACGLWSSPLYQRTSPGDHGPSPRSVPTASLGKMPGQGQSRGAARMAGAGGGNVTMSCPERATVPPTAELCSGSPALGPADPRLSGIGAHSPAGSQLGGLPGGDTSWESHTLLPPFSPPSPKGHYFCQKSFAHLFSSSWSGKSLWARLGE